MVFPVSYELLRFNNIKSQTWNTYISIRYLKKNSFNSIYTTVPSLLQSLTKCCIWIYTTRFNCNKCCWHGQKIKAISANNNNNIMWNKHVHKCDSDLRTCFLTSIYSFYTWWNVKQIVKVTFHHRTDCE